MYLKVRILARAAQKIYNCPTYVLFSTNYYPVIIAHGDAMYLVDEFTKMLKDKFGDDIKYTVIPVNPTAGCHCGPDVLGIGFHAKER